METYLDDVKMIFLSWLKLKQHHSIDVILGTVIANQFKTDPISLYVIGPPSVGKTEILRSLSGYPKVYHLSNFSSNALISGMKGKTSLLLKLKEMDKSILVIKDFTTILETRPDVRSEVISQMREIMDGRFSKSYGTGRTIYWEGKLAFICGVTPVIDEYRSIHSILGERFLNFRFEPEESDEENMTERAFNMAGKEKEMRGELQGVVCDFLNQFKDPKFEDIGIAEDLKNKLFALVGFIARARTGVSRDPYSKVVNYLPQPEGTPRLIKQLWTLGCGITLIQGKKEFDEEVYSIIKEVGKHSLSNSRWKIIKTMYENEVFGLKWETTKSISKLINCPTVTTRLYLEDLMLLGLINRRISGDDDTEDDSWKLKDTNPYLWKLSDKCLDYLYKSEILNNCLNGNNVKKDDFKT